MLNFDAGIEAGNLRRAILLDGSLSDGPAPSVNRRMDQNPGRTVNTGCQGIRCFRGKPGCASSSLWQLVGSAQKKKSKTKGPEKYLYLKIMR